LLRQLYPHYGVAYFCAVFGKSRQAWYESIHRQTEQQLSDTMILKLVAEIRSELPRIGTRKLYHLLSCQLESHRIKIGRDKLYELLGYHGYLLRYRRRKAHTTNSNHAYRKYPNLIRDLVLTNSNQLWVSDITYIRLQQGFCYLSIITDAYSRKIVGHCLHPTLSSEGVINALQIALGQAAGKRSLIHHSDRGIQYCCADYVQLLEHHHIQISMTEKGDPYENAIAERVNGILKNEFDLHKAFSSCTEASQVVDLAITKYNHIRPHSSCDYLTPVRAHEQSGWMRKRWKSQLANVDMLITPSDPDAAPLLPMLST
jgi:transposase InsO family protein